jgi:flagellar hook-length control protein FliK
MIATAKPENTPKDGAPQVKKVPGDDSSAFGKVLAKEIVGKLVKAREGTKKPATPLLHQVKDLLQPKQKKPLVLGAGKASIKTEKLALLKSKDTIQGLPEQGNPPEVLLISLPELMLEDQPKDEQDSVKKKSRNPKSAEPAISMRLQPKDKSSTGQRLRIEVRDQRKKMPLESKTNPFKSKQSQRLQASKAFSLQQNNSPAHSQSSENVIEVQVSRPVELPNGEIRLMPVTEAREALTQLSQQIRNTTGPEIIQMAKFVLKDQDMGEIKLRLKPEALGEVKINLNLNNGRLGGNILVENNAVRDIFQNSLDNLVRGFKDEGFETTGLDVNVRGEQSYQDQQNQHQEHRGRTAVWLESEQAESLEPIPNNSALRSWYGYNTVDFKA